MLDDSCFFVAGGAAGVDFVTAFEDEEAEEAEDDDPSERELRCPLDCFFSFCTI